MLELYGGIEDGERVRVPLYMEGAEAGGAKAGFRSFECPVLRVLGTRRLILPNGELHTLDG